MQDESFLADPGQLAARTLAQAIKPPPPVDLNKWAADNVVFGKESPITGRYQPDKFPFYRAILDALGPDDPARIVVLKKSAQIGGTVVAQVFMGGTLDLDPGPFLYVHPTEDNATRWARQKWRPMIRLTAALNRIFDLRASKEGGNSTLYQERRDGRGFIQISGASSEASLSMMSMPRQVQDDLAKWQNNGAGDPEGQADSRSKAFEWAKIFKNSTPLIADGCRITRAFKSGTQEHYHVPCPHCGHEHPLDWDGMKAHLDEAHPEDAHFVCPECGGLIENRHRADIVARGRWVAHNPGASVRSFYLWSAYAPLESWQRIAESWIAARGDPAKEQSFENDVVGRAYEAAGESPPWEGLRDRAEAGKRRRGIIPRGALLTTISADCQDDRVEWALIGWGRDLHRWVIEVGVVEGHISEPECQTGLNAVLSREWPAEAGARRQADLMGIDGNAYTTEVFDWVRGKPSHRVLMLRGVAGDTEPPLAIIRKERGRDGKIKKYAKRFYNVGTSGLKLGFYKFLAVADPIMRGYVSFPAGLGDAYFEQVTAEKRVPVTDRRGFTSYQWQKARSTRNEQLDLMVYGEALASRLGWRIRTDWDHLEAEREAAPGSAQIDLFEAVPVPPKPVAVLVGTEPVAKPPKAKPPVPVPPRPVVGGNALERMRALGRRMGQR